MSRASLTRYGTSQTAEALPEDALLLGGASETESIDVVENLTSSELALEAVGVSLSQSLAELSRADVAALMFLQTYHAARGTPRHTGAQGQLGDLGENFVQSFSRLRRRAILTAAIGIWDSFLSDALRFWLLHKPHELAEMLPKNGKLDDSETREKLEFVVRSRLKSWRSRMDFLCDRLEVTIDDAAREELSSLIDVRNELVHHVGMYAFDLSSQTGEVGAKARRVPEVTPRDAMAATLYVTEASDAILVALSQSLHGRAPQVRPMTENVRKAHALQREQWSRHEARDREVERILRPGWRSAFDAQLGRHWVGDRPRFLRIICTGIDSRPALIRFGRSTVHGTDPVFTVDGGESRSAWADELLNEMLQGRELEIEFAEAGWEHTRRVVLSLDGFAAAWEAANGNG